MNAIERLDQLFHNVALTNATELSVVKSIRLHRPDSHSWHVGLRQLQHRLKTRINYGAVAEMLAKPKGARLALNFVMLAKPN